MQSSTHPNGVICPKIIFEDGVYKIWYTNVYNSAVADIWYATSEDGINWTVQTNSPVLNYGSYGSWDSQHVGTGAIIKDNNEYKMYYLGFSDEYSSWDIGLATSTDGLNWIKYPNPVVYADYSEYQIGANDIIKVDSIYYLYYSSRNYPYYDIRLATSEDGINFTKYEGNPILIADKSWESTGVNNASVIYENNQFKMIYMNATGTAFGMATSTDGKNWDKVESNPFFTKNDTQNNWCQKILYPFWRKFNNQYRIYYTGNTNEITQKIGMIYK